MDSINLFDLLAVLAAFYLPLPVSFGLLLLSFFRVRKRRMLAGAMLGSGIGLVFEYLAFKAVNDHIRHENLFVENKAYLLALIFGVSLLLFLRTEHEKL